LGPQCQTPRYLQKQLQYMLRARQYISIHNSNLRLTLQGQSILTESFDTITKALWAPNLPTLKTLVNHIAFSLMDSRIPSLSRLLRRHSHTKWQQPLIQIWQQNQNESNYCNKQACFFVELKEYNPPSSSVTYTETRTRHLAKKKGLGGSMLLL